MTTGTLPPIIPTSHHPEMMTKAQKVQVSFRPAKGPSHLLQGGVLFSYTVAHENPSPPTSAGGSMPSLSWGPETQGKEDAPEGREWRIRHQKGFGGIQGGKEGVRREGGPTRNGAGVGQRRESLRSGLPLPSPPRLATPAGSGPSPFSPFSATPSPSSSRSSSGVDGGGQSRSPGGAARE